MKIRTTALALALASASLIPLARADIPPVCDMFADRVTCSKADLGKACATGGTCYEVTCASSAMPGPQQSLYKCEVCPPLIDGGACSTTYGAPCGEDAGLCRKAPPWCNQGQLGIACFGPAPELAPAPVQEAGADASSKPEPDATTGGGETSDAEIAKMPDASTPATGVADSDGGCSVASVASRVSRRAALPSFMLSVGGLALLLERLRRSRSKK